MKNTVPAMIAMLMVLIYNLADTFFIGQTKDAFMVASVSLVTPVFFIYGAWNSVWNRRNQCDLPGNGSCHLDAYHQYEPLGTDLYPRNFYPSGNSRNGRTSVGAAGSRCVVRNISYYFISNHTKNEDEEELIK